MAVDVVWEDPYAMVINKPSGLLTTAARGIESVETQLQQFFKDRNASEVPFVGLPHRIDRPVSGALLVGKTRAATKQFCAQFQTRKIQKNYLAILETPPVEPEATWRDTMRKIADRAEAEICLATDADAKEAILHYRLLGSLNALQCLSIQLETGRTHQIRLQTSHRGLPILGDMQYGSTANFGPTEDDPRRRAIALHAHQIEFRHPKSGRATRITAPLPQTWQDLGFDDALIANWQSGLHE